MLQWEMLHPMMTMDHLGYIPTFVYENDPASAKDQFNARYVYGGWQPFKGFRLGEDNSLNYPGDPPQVPRAQAKLCDELIVFYDHAWVAIIQSDRTFEVCRMD